MLARLAPATPTPWHRLNPLTRATVVVGVTIAAVVLGGYLAPLILFLAVVVPAAAIAGVLPRAVRLALLVSLPVLVSVVLVSVFTRAGAFVLFEVGPFAATLEGVDFAAQVALRIVVLATALALYGLTTEPRVLVADLERRGASPRLTFGVLAALEAVPAMLERARTVIDAQRARGLDTEGSVGARLRALPALVGPVLLSSLASVEERSVALEARGFTRPGRREPLWAPPDSEVERVARWAIVAAVAVVVLGRLAGLVPDLP